MAIIAATLAGIKSDPLTCLGGKQQVNNHFALAGHAWRRRLLDPATTLMLFILQVLHGNTAITHLRHLSGLKVAKSSYCAARKRLPLEALARLVEHVSCDAIKCIHSLADGPALWLGRRVILADATSATGPDTPELQAQWPQPSAQKKGCGFPMIKLLGALDLATGMILHLTMACMNCHEMSLLPGMHASLQSGDVLLADRGFCSFIHLALLSVFPMDAVFRMHQRVIVDFTPGRSHRGRSKGRKRGKQRKGGKRRKCGIPTSRYVRKLGREDHIVEWIKPRQKPRWIDARVFAGLAPVVQVRELRYRIATRGSRTRVVTIATTLLDPMRYPKSRIAELYGLRWEVETNFRHLKQTMNMDQLKSKSVDGILKELMIFVLVYNLIRCAMTLAAARQGVDVARISFIDTMRWLCCGMTSGHQLPGESMIDLVVNPIRPGRYHPRVKKRRIKEYDLMNKTRREYAKPSDGEGVTA